MNKLIKREIKTLKKKGGKSEQVAPHKPD